MSTDYKLLEDGTHEFSIVESSSGFTLAVIENDQKRHPDSDGICIITFPRGPRLDAEQVIDVAVKMIQPTLWNVKDPSKLKELILQKINSIFE